MIRRKNTDICVLHGGFDPVVNITQPFCVVLQFSHGSMRWMYSPASNTEGEMFSEFCKLAKVSFRFDIVLGVSVSDSEAEPSEVWQK